MSNTFDEFTTATGDALARFERWAADPHGQPTLPADVELAIVLASTIGSRCEVPVRGRTLACIAFPALDGLLTKYLNGELNHRTADGSPGAMFVQGYHDVRHAFDLMYVPPASAKTPVAQLKSEGVDPRQIAMIYSVNGEGPFYDEAGTVLVELVEQEATSPGSIIKTGWEAELIERQAERQIADIRNRIAELDGKPFIADEARENENTEPSRRGRPRKQAV